VPKRGPFFSVGGEVYHVPAGPRKIDVELQEVGRTVARTRRSPDKEYGVGALRISAA
jgi:hypothetical protein